MKATVYLSRKLLNQLKVKETESKDLMLTHNLHNIIINGKRVGCSGRIIMRNRETFGLSDHEVLNMAYDWSGKGLDFLYKRGWIAIRNPSMGNTFLDMDETKTATKAQVNTIFDYISKFNRYDMNVSKVMAD